MKLPYWINTAWMLKCQFEAKAFRRATRSVAQTQAGVLRSILKSNAYTIFGQRHGLHAIPNVLRYQQQVPLSTFDDCYEYIEQVAAGVPNVLTRQPVELLEPTSGTTRGEKLVPYTRSLREQFQRGVAAWTANLLSHRPAVREGRAYWSVSPNLGKTRHSPAGIPIGFDDDTAYMGKWGRLFANRMLVVPPSVARMPNIVQFRYLTLLHLLRATDLTLISVWNPTFLTALLDNLESWQEQLCLDIRNGTTHLGDGADRGNNIDLPVNFPPDPKRPAQLRSVFASSESWSDKFRATWPGLAVISCWADGSAAWAVPELERLFPVVEIQPKGLLATEAFVSFPLIDRPGAALALRCHFFEFEEVNGHESHSNGPVRLAHELELSGRYRVVVTTGGGLYRYQLRDEVVVVGFEDQCPLLRFLGKTDCISDIVGEKLSEPHVRRVLRNAFASSGLAPTFALVVPVDTNPPRYRLYVQGAEQLHQPMMVESLAKSLELGLQENPHYRYAVSLGQLAPAEVSLLDDTKQAGPLQYEQRCLKLGQRLGDIKPTTLDPRPGWDKTFVGSVAVSSGTVDADYSA